MYSRISSVVGIACILSTRAAESLAPSWDWLEKGMNDEIADLNTAISTDMEKTRVELRGKNLNKAIHKCGAPPNSTCQRCADFTAKIQKVEGLKKVKIEAISIAGSPYGCEKTITVTFPAQLKLDILEGSVEAKLNETKRPKCAGYIPMRKIKKGWNQKTVEPAFETNVTGSLKISNATMKVQMSGEMKWGVCRNYKIGDNNTVDAGTTFSVNVANVSGKGGFVPQFLQMAAKNGVADGFKDPLLDVYARNIVALANNLTDAHSHGVMDRMKRSMTPKSSMAKEEGAAAAALAETPLFRKQVRPHVQEQAEKL